MVGRGRACGMGWGESRVQPRSTLSVTQFTGEEGVLENSTCSTVKTY